jgi:DNA-binding CsgD family transcriptional regulator
MSAVPASTGVPLRLRVVVIADNPATERRLAELIAWSGHQPVGASEPADAVLTNRAEIGTSDLPTVAIGVEEGDFGGLLPNDTGPAQLDAALRAAAAGLIVRPPSPPQPGFAPLPEAPSPVLTPREIVVLTALADGLGNKAVARRLGISPHTVKFHIESLFRKLGAATRAEAVAKGLRRQIVEF